MEKSKMKNRLKTADVYFCAALLSVGAKYEGADKTDPRHMEFEVSLNYPNFQAEPLASAVLNGNIQSVLGLEYYEKAWANGELMVNATKYKEAIQRMKAIIHSKD